MKGKQSTLLSLCLTILLSYLSLNAWSMDKERQKQLQKQYEFVIKQIKKTTDTKKVVVHEASDGTTWIVGRDIMDNLALFNTQGKQITPYKIGENYYNDVRYIPALQAGFSDIPVRKYNLATQSLYIDGTFKLYHQSSPAVVVACGFKDLVIYTPEGKVLKTISHIKNPNNGSLFLYYKFFPGYIITGNEGEVSSSDFATRLMVQEALAWGELTGVNNLESNLKTAKEWSLNNMATVGGLEVTPCEFNYGGIYTIDGKLLVDSITGYSISEDQYCIYTKHIDGVDKKGVLKLDDPSFQIPCVFASIMQNKDKWLVQKSSIDPFSEYNPHASYAGSFRDEGEKLYNQKKWQEVIEYYATKGMDKPWSLFFTGMAIYQKAYHEGYIYKYGFQSRIEKNEINPFTHKYYNDCALIPYEQNIVLFGQAAEILQAYMEVGEDSTYLKTAKYKIPECLSLKKDMEDERAKFNRCVQKYNQHNTAQKAAMEAEQQRKAAMWGAIIGSVSNSLQHALSGGKSRNVSTPTRTSGSYKSGTKTQTSSSSGGEDNTDRKIFLKNQITDWKNKLKKAEASLNQAKESYSKNQSWETKRLVESKENTVNECLDMIRQYESELNSLK